MKIAASMILGLVVSFISELFLEGIHISIGQIVENGRFSGIRIARKGDSQLTFFHFLPDLIFSIA